MRLTIVVVVFFAVIALAVGNPVGKFKLKKIDIEAENL